MSQVRKADPYRKLLRIAIVLLVLFVLLLTAYLLLDSYQKGQWQKQQLAVIEQNNAMVEEYNKQVLAQRSEMGQVETKPWPQAKAEGIDILELKGIPVTGEDPQLIARTDALMGGLLVVNRWHPLPADFANVENSLQSIMDGSERRVATRGRALSLFPEAVTALDTMFSDARAEGMQHLMVEHAYRTIQTQTDLWNNEASQARYSRYSGDALDEQVRKLVSYPGESDYQAGLSINVRLYSANDPTVAQQRFFESEQSKWLYENAHKYGYVFRFPVAGYPVPEVVDKSFKTGIGLKMDTYRYVGVPHALVMREKDFCLEEYVEYLIDQQHIAVYQDGVLKYEIFHVTADAEDTQVNIPAGASSYTASADNVRGLIITAEYN